MKRREGSNRLDGTKRMLRSGDVQNRYVQDKGSNIQIVGSDMEVF